MFFFIFLFYDLCVVVIGFLRKQKKVNYFFLKKKEKCLLYGWYQFVSFVWFWEGMRIFNIVEKNLVILGVFGFN